MSLCSRSPFSGESNVFLQPPVGQFFSSTSRCDPPHNLVHKKNESFIKDKSSGFETPRDSLGLAGWLFPTALIYCSIPLSTPRPQRTHTEQWVRRSGEPSTLAPRQSPLISDVHFAKPVHNGSAVRFCGPDSDETSRGMITKSM